MEKKFSKKYSVKERDSIYKEKYEILDEKYTKIKGILKQVLTELREEKDNQHLLKAEYEKLSVEIKEKDALLERMQSVSEAVIDEYSALKVKCDLETEAANNAIKRATKYFQENQKLKRTTHFENGSPDGQEEESNELLSQDPCLEENISELDVLNKLASELRTEIAGLKIQLGKEIEKQNSLKEDFEIAKNLYEQEMKDHKYTKEELETLQLHFNNSKDGGSESERCTHHISLPSNQLEETGSDQSSSRVSDPLVVNDALVAKLEFAEQQLADYKQQNNCLLSKVRELECQIRKLNAEVSASESLPIPPPPPPPPLPPPAFNPIKSLITFIHAGKKSSKMPKKENTENPQQKAMSEMIDAIKKGNIQLKPTPKVDPQSPKKETGETALGEMKSILVTLKKKNSCQSIKFCEEISSCKQLHSPERSTGEYSNEDMDENFNVGPDIDDELKALLRKRSLKITENNSVGVKLCTNPSGADNSDIVENNIEIQESTAADENRCVDNISSESRTLSSENEVKRISCDNEAKMSYSENEVKRLISDNEVKMPSSDNEVKMPSSDNEVKMPSSDNEVKMPSSDNEVKLPSTDNEVKIPSTDNEVKMPSTDNEVKMPSSENEVKSPSSENEVKSRSSENEVKSPSLEIEVNMLSSENEIKMPGSENEVKMPSSDNEVKSPCSENEVNMLSSENEIKMPGSENEVKRLGSENEVNHDTVTV